MIFPASYPHVASPGRRSAVTCSERARPCHSSIRTTRKCTRVCRTTRPRRSGKSSSSATYPRSGLESAEALLTRLRKRLDQPLTFERKRQLVELLVGGIRIETIRNGAQRENVVTVTHRFPSAV